MPPPLIPPGIWLSSGTICPPVEPSSRPPWGGATVAQRDVRVRALRFMHANIPAERLRLVARHCPNPYDTAITKRDWEIQCSAYRQRCKITLPALAFLEFGIAYEEEEALFYLESLRLHRSAAIAPSFLESLD
jgi:hypothetical protein